VSRSNLRPFLNTIPFVVALVAGVRPLACQQTEAQFIASVNSAIQPLLSLAPGKPIIMGANLLFAEGLLVPGVNQGNLLDYVDGLKAAGVQRIEFNPAYTALSDPAVTAKYDAAVDHIRQLGLMLVINPEYYSSQQPVTSFQQFQAAAVAGAAQLAARYQPDNFVIVHEPDTMANRMGVQTTVQDWDGFIKAVAPLIRQKSPRTRLGAGCFYGFTQGASASENAYFEDFATIPDLDFLTMDIYVDDSFSQFQQWAQLAHANGKAAYIEETWTPPYYANGLPADWSTEGLDATATVGPASGDFASLDTSWLHALVLFASANGMESVTPFATPAFFQYGTAGADRISEAAYDIAAAFAIAQGQLTPTGQAYLTYNQQWGIKVATSLSSASYATLPSVFCSSATNPKPCNGNANSTVAPDELVSAFGVDLATSNASTPSASFPTTLAGTTATLVDSSNKSHPVPLAYVSPGQVNYLVPSAAQPGAAALTFTSADGTKTTGIVLVAAVDPGLYTANSNGKGAPAAFAVCAGTCAGWPRPPNSYGQFVQDLFTAGAAGGWVPQLISLGAAKDTVVLELFGTGLRHASSTSAVTATIYSLNGLPILQNLPVQFVGAQGQFTGEDQINVPLPHSLAGSGTVSLVLTLRDTVDNTTPSSNAVTIDIE
jgi:uncharacterized protein (TIGR03437 family)